MTEANTLSIWTVYDHPSDYPDEFVAREWTVSAGQIVATPNLIRTKRHDFLVKEMTRRGLTRLDRNPDDDPAIMETWF